jgi:hypothetical protein
MVKFHTYVLWLGKVQKLALKETNQYEDIVLITFIISFFNKLLFLNVTAPIIQLETNHNKRRDALNIWSIGWRGKLNHAKDSPKTPNFSQVLTSIYTTLFRCYQLLHFNNIK